MITSPPWSKRTYVARVGSPTPKNSTSTVEEPPAQGRTAPLTVASCVRYGSHGFEIQVWSVGSKN